MRIMPDGRSSVASPHATSCEGRTPRARSSPVADRALTKIQPAAQLPCCLLPPPDLVGGRRCKQPPGKCFFAGAGARRAQQLKKRGSSEEVQVACVRMRRFKKMLAGDPCTCPTALQASHAMLIKPDGAGAGGDATNQPSVHDCKHREGGDRNKNQQIARVEMAQAEQDPNQTDCCQCELHIASQPLPALNPGAAYRQFAQPPRIFCSRRLGRNGLARHAVCHVYCFKGTIVPSTSVIAVTEPVLAPERQKAEQAAVARRRVSPGIR